MNRKEITKNVEDLGTKANDLRQEALAANMPFTCGLIRAAEEALLIAYNALSDETVTEDKL